MINYLANPNRFMKVVSPFEKSLGIISICLILIGLYFALLNSPQDYQQGDTVRIMYIHVPCAWFASFLYLGLSLTSITFLIWKHPFADIVARSIAPLGLIFSILTLITGSLWGKPMWGTWWVWDARLTSMLILCIFYATYIGISNAFPRKSDGSKPAAVLAIIGLINLPIIKFSVDWWNTLHQPASIFKIDGPSIDDSMLIPLTIMLFAFLFISSYVIIMNIKTNLVIKKYHSEKIKLD